MFLASPADIIMCSAIYLVFEDATPCDGSPATLNERSGSFGINQEQYVNNMTCGWMIHVPSYEVKTVFVLKMKINKTV